MSEKIKDQKKVKANDTSSEESKDMPPLPPDGGYGWVITLASFFNHIIVDGFAFTFGVFYPRILESFPEAGDAAIALVGSLMAGTYFLGAPIGSALINKFGCRKVCVGGALWAFSWFAISTQSPNVYVLMLTYGVLGGTGLGFIYLPSIISVTYYFHKRRALATGLAVCGAGVGTFVYAPFGEYLLNTFGWKGALLIESAIILNGAVFGALLRPLEPAKNLKSSENSEEDVKALVKESVSNVKTAHSNGGSKANGHGVNYGVNGNGKAGHDIKIIVSGEDSPPPYTSIGNGTNECKKSVLFTNKDANRLNIVKSADSAGSRKSLSAGDIRVAVKQGGKRKTSSKPDIAPTSAEKGGETQGRRRSRTSSVSSNDKYSRPLYRKDIFLSGSILHVPEFRSTPNVSAYISEVTVVPGGGTIAEEYEGDVEGRVGGKMSLRRRMKTATDAIKMMLNLGLFADPIFIVACAANVLAMFALFLPFIFIVQLAESKDVKEGSILLSVIGITNTAARVVIGLLAILPWVNTIIVHNMSLILMGVALIGNQFCLNFYAMCVSAGLFGVGLAGFISLTSVILCNMLGLQKLTNAFGLLTMFRGAAVIAGPPVAGLLYVYSQDYDIVFNIAGVAMIGAGVIFCAVHLPCLAPFRFDLEQKAAEQRKLAAENDDI